MVVNAPMIIMRQINRFITLVIQQRCVMVEVDCDLMLVKIGFVRLGSLADFLHGDVVKQHLAYAGVKSDNIITMDSSEYFSYSVNNLRGCLDIRLLDIGALVSENFACLCRIAFKPFGRNIADRIAVGDRLVGFFPVAFAYTSRQFRAVTVPTH